jgi:hypothetical protein
MNPDSPNGRRFRVSISAAVGSTIKELGQRARVAGRFEEFKSAFRKIAAALEHHPESYGDPYVTHSEIGIVEYLRIERPIRLFYGVDRSRGIVYIVGVYPFPEDTF